MSNERLVLYKVDESVCLAFVFYLGCEVIGIQITTKKKIIILH